MPKKNQAAEDDQLNPEDIQKAADENQQQEEPKKPEQPAVDIEAIKAAERDKAKAEALAEAAQTAAREQAERDARLVEALTGKKPDQRTEDEIPPWEKENRTPKDWSEMADFSSKLAAKRLDAAAEERTKAQQAAQTEAQKAEAQRIASVNALWDEEITALRERGDLPAMADANDPNDPGRKELVNLLTQMQSVNQQRATEGKQTIQSVAAFHNLYYQPSGQPAGADAPISLGKRGASPVAKDSYSYEDIHNSSFRDILMEGQPKA